MENGPLYSIRIYIAEPCGNELKVNRINAKNYFCMVDAIIVGAGPAAAYLLPVSFQSQRPMFL